MSETPRMSPKLRALLILPPILLGIAALAWFVQGREPPVQAEPGEAATRVRVIAAPAVAVVPRAVGYGSVQPGNVWGAVAQVSGRAVERHPRLKRGEILPAGAVLVRIDPTDYELAVREIRSDIRGVKAQLAELDTREQNTRASLDIEERALAISKRELERKRRLVERGTVSQAAVDQEEKTYLSNRQRVQELKNILALIPAERGVLEARLALNEAKLEQARLDLERTEIATPFAGRVSEVNVERTQFVKEGEVLAVVDAIDVSEVPAQIPIEKMRTVVARDFDPARITPDMLGDLPEMLGLSAVVRLRSGDLAVEWDARFARISDTIDPKTRTVGVIVAVDAPYRKAQPGVRPPLVKNMFVEVEVRGRPKPETVVVPRAGLHGDRVYVANAEDRLEIREVEIGFAQSDFATIESGLTAGERVVVTDLVPAIAGMLLQPVADAAALARLVAEAEGRAEVR